jgi:hypothetical protein
MNLISNKVEQTLKQIILKDLANHGREGWDKPHTEAVVYWIKQLLQKVDSDLDSQVLITAAYAHDWGYAGMFEGIDSSNYDEIQKRKAQHMNIGAVKIERLIYQRLAQDFTERQILRVVHLVEKHDSFDEIEDEDEIMLLEADTLGAMDINRTPGSMDYDSNQKYLRDVREKRLPLFKHQPALDIGQQLLQQRVDFYKNKFSQ